jgi:2'-5' RNA ligase
VKRDFGLTSETIEALDEEVKALIEAQLSQAYLKYPHVSEYIEFVRQRAPYVVGQELTQKPVFMVLKPDSRFRSVLARRVKVWKEKYPALQFTDPADSHMTLHYSGRMSETALDAWVKEARGSAGSIPEAQQGGIYIMGRQNQVIALKFSPSVEFSTLAKTMRAFATRVGGVPEKTFLEFTPHITLATIKDKGSVETQAQVRRFMAEVTGALSMVSFDDFEIWTQKGEQATAPATPSKYLKIR